jgi:CRP-like cAMP-binding protein
MKSGAIEILQLMFALDTREPRTRRVSRSASCVYGDGLHGEVNRMAVKIEELLDSSDLTKKNIDFQKNEIIFSQGDPAKAVFYLRKGLVRLSVTSHTGKEAIVEMMRPGDFFGTWCLADHPLRMATATAMERTTACMISKNQILRILNSEHRLSDGLVSCLLARNIRIGRDLANLLLNSAEKRLARKLQPIRDPGQDRHNAPQSSHPKVVGGDDWNHP